MDVQRNIRDRINKWSGKRKAIIITGARQVGKSTMLRQMYGDRSDVLWLNADEADVRAQFSGQITVASLSVLIGNHQLVIIDEVQRLKAPGLLLKLLVDNFPDVQLVATGSSALEIAEGIFEPLTGRHYLFHLYPFGLLELYPKVSSLEVRRQLEFHLVFGSYPDICLQREDAEMNLRHLADQYLYKDVLIWKDIRKPELLDRLLKLLAYQIGSEVSVNELANALGVKSETVESYIDLLEKSFVVFRLGAYSTNPRKEVTKMKKVYFWDNGIRNAVIGNFDPLSIRQDVGALWENFMVTERLKYWSWREEYVEHHFWRNWNQSEVDLVETEGSCLRAYEFKWSPGKARVSRAFTNAYPASDTFGITRESFEVFCGTD